MSETPSKDALRTEATVFGRYLVGGTPADVLVARYVAANQSLFPEPIGPRDAACLDFACGHPWSVAFLDAASGLFRPQSLLRKKLLVMAAILEATTTHATDFMPRPRSTPMLVAILAWNGITGAFRATVGALVLTVVERGRR